MKITSNDLINDVKNIINNNGIKYIATELNIAMGQFRDGSLIKFLININLHFKNYL